MGYAKYLEDNEDIWTENNRHNGNISIYGARTYYKQNYMSKMENHYNREQRENTKEWMFCNA